MVTWYPHTLELSTPADSEQDADGNWVAAAGTTVETLCRAEVRERVTDGLRPATDGNVIQYGWVIYMPQGAPSLPVGASVTVKDESLNIVASDTVKRFSRGQLNARAWL